MAATGTGLVMEKRYRIPELPVFDENEYVADYKHPTSVVVGEHNCIIPYMPPDRYIKNSRQATANQKFEYTEIPTGLKKSYDEEKVVRREWHRRLHGVWWMINGQPYYMTGRAYHFFNYWRTTENKRPLFRMEAMMWYWLWDDVYMDEDCFGLLDIKCRRLGDTEKGLHVCYEEMTRFRNTIAGMQHMKVDDAKKNYLRLVNGHRHMAYFFRPQSRGSTNPMKKLELVYPEQAITAKQAREKDFYDDINTLPALGSTVDYEATEVRAYDGQRLSFYLGDEYGKINPNTMNQIEQWNIIKRCMALNNDTDIVGKAYLPTTVEDVANGTSVAMMAKFWEQSDPNNLVNGRTTTGLRRIFRGFQLAARIDEYGFHKVREAEQWRDAEIQRLLDLGDHESVVTLQRKQPRDIHEALQIAAQDCTLNPHLLDTRLMQLKTENRVHVRRGNLEWSEGQGSNVVFVDDAKGKWWISQMPVTPNRRVSTDQGLGPGNTHIYSGGGDPIDSKTKKGSDGALAIYRKFNLADEPKSVDIDSNGDVMNPEDMVTDQFVCIYSARPDDPYKYFDDALKTAVFYGVKMFFELQKPYVVNKFRDTGYRNYLAKRPKETIVNTRDKRAGSQQEGTAATAMIISNYVDLLRSHISKRWKTYKILVQLEDFRRFNTENRTERDISVASGFALLSGMDSRMRAEIDETKTIWDELPFETY